MSDPFQFLDEMNRRDDPIYRAPSTAIESWLELAEKARVELTRMGFTASVVPDEDPYGLPPGAQIWVSAIQPFGITLDWVAPVTDTRRYHEIALTQDANSALFRYVLKAEQIIVEALLAMLQQAGFQVLAEHSENNGYTYRILSAPEAPVN